MTILEYKTREQDEMTINDEETHKRADHNIRKGFKSKWHIIRSQNDFMNQGTEVYRDDIKHTQDPHHHARSTRAKSHGQDLDWSKHETARKWNAKPAARATVRNKHQKMDQTPSTK